MNTPEFSLSKFIKDYVMTNRITISDLARRMEVPQSTVARWASGKTTPSIHQLGNLAHATGTDICFLVDLIVPGERREIPVSAREIAERIGRLPKDRQDLIDTILIGITAQAGDEKPKSS